MGEWIRFWITAALMLAGLFILASGVFGVFKFKYVLNRMHAAAMGDTLGLMLSIAALIVSSRDWFLSCKLLLIVAFLWCASPVSSHLICRLETATSDKWHSIKEL